MMRVPTCPKQWQEETAWCEGGYPHYRRRKVAAGEEIQHKDGIRDHRWVAPYNPMLLKKYKCHLNVEEPKPTIALDDDEGKGQN